MKNTKKAIDLANKHLFLNGVKNDVRFNRKIYRGFLDAIDEALIISFVGKCICDNPEPYIKNEEIDIGCKKCNKDI